ncbi:P-loop NTPase fold protein [Colwellia sp. 12G3]|uniref:P-loop NTPase fold protein n=1 Tax=Colwellia sp. 12G3 TaxID=2058299 RepID=UPI000C327165|nr:P-loop NTPase fold protein [Colwellia sp. 12G3]PKI18098.1 hypothetical protein CXF71_00570 [Colwellia sp. 12G3]
MNTDELKTVIKGYLSITKPMYATMINGPWGCGKTTFIKELLEEEKQKYLYISLYGVSSTSDIENKVFTSISSIDGVSNDEVSSVGKFIGGITNLLSDTNGGSVGAIATTLGGTIKSRFINGISKDYCLIFDDLERSTLSKSDVLAYINSFIEQQKLNVVILCAEDTFDEPKYKKEKEKTVLFTNNFIRKEESIVEIAFSDELNLPVDILEGSKIELIRLLKNIPCSNLRTINYAINCYSRLVRILEENKHELKGEECLINLIFPCFAYAIGYKDMGLDSSTLEAFTTDTTSLYMKYSKKDKEELDEQTINAKIFYETVVTKEHNQIDFLVVYKLVCLGHLDYSVFKKDLTRWDKSDVILENFVLSFPINVRDQVFQEGLENTLNKIINKEFIVGNSGELYKLVSYFHYFIKTGAFNYELEMFENEVTEYVNYSIENYGCTNEYDPFINSRDSEPFLNKISEIITAKTTHATNINLVEECQHILIKGLEGTDGDNSFKNLYNNSIFPFITEPFVDILFESYICADNNMKSSFMSYFRNRYQSTNIMDFLGDEVEPLKKLSDLIDTKLKNSSPSLSHYHLKQFKAALVSINNKSINNN